MKFLEALEDMAKDMNKVLNVKCPTCEKEFNYYGSEFRPFCCEKCRLIDLGHWFKESYAVPAKDEKSQTEQDNKNHPNDGDDSIDEESEYL